ncbi:MAG: hypothetical protein MRZ66_00290 [Clostridiales bacterium]|nr:hypothetical protein [Clostridiales bacterium]
MIDMNPHVKKLLEKTGVKVQQGTVFEFTNKALITFRKVTTDEGFHSDNKEDSQVSKFAVDIWSNSPVQVSNIGVKVNEIMQADGWTRTFDYDVPRGSPIELYHCSQRYKKEVYF